MQPSVTSVLRNQLLKIAAPPSTVQNSRLTMDIWDAIFHWAKTFAGTDMDNTGFPWCTILTCPMGDFYYKATYDLYHCETDVEDADVELTNGYYRCKLISLLHLLGRVRCENIFTSLLLVQ